MPHKKVHIDRSRFDQLTKSLAAVLITSLAGFVLLFAQDLNLTSWARPRTDGPIVRPDNQSTFRDEFHDGPVRWRALHTFNPAAIVRDGRVYVLFRAEDDSGSMAIGAHTSRIGMAVSDDGVHFKVEPVLYPARDTSEQREWPGGTEDPRIVESDNGTYVMTYTQWNWKTYDVGIATSKDLVHWKKWGPAFHDCFGGKYRSLLYKSAGIVTSLRQDRLIAAKVNGKYLMYWGEGHIGLATSADLIHWNPVEGKDGNPVVVLDARPGYFDSELPEVGPPPVLMENRIVLIYNGKNAVTERDKTLAPGVYSTGSASFRADAPNQLVSRSSRPFLKPERPYEQTGQYKAGTTFSQGLVRFHGKWFLYYGCADSFVGVAVSGAAQPD